MGQNQSVHPHHADPSHTDSQLSDPVCGMRVTEDSPHHTEHEGKSFYFCSTKCLGRFRDDPEKYLNPSKSEEHTTPMSPARRTLALCIRRSCKITREPVQSVAWLLSH